jgi:hypothetical protein
VVVAVTVAVAWVRFVASDKAEEHVVGHVVGQLLEDGQQGEGRSVEPWGRQAWQVWGAQ